MGPNKLPLLFDLVLPLVPFISGNADLLINARKAAEFFQLSVHRLILDYRKRLIPREVEVLVLIENPSRDIIQFNGYTVTGFHSCHFKMIIFDIIAPQNVDVGVPKTGEAAEKKYITDGLKVR